MAGTTLAAQRLMTTPHASKTTSNRPKQAAQQASSKKGKGSTPPGVSTPSSERASRDSQEKNGNGQRKGAKGAAGRR